ncbi:MAG: hypothetical protein KME42_00750 [Tildeniella nuda ZEHNDER 1965/U140]|jgi:hypothetical protein|nr:hypothetical protein [Tildeniella nuda ZEHNDER 1965/U140]
MTYQKRRSATLEKAQSRLSGLQSVHFTINLGNGLTLQDYAALIATADTQLQTHNLALAEADRTRIEFAETEAALTALSSRLLSAVVAMYGKNSKEYEMAGGKPPSTYKRSKKQASTTSSTAAQNGDTASTNGAITNGATTAAPLPH